MKIEMRTDHYFEIGDAHFGSGKPCQDYALSGIISGMAYAVVSDGCSSGGHTDIGSRVEALTAVKSLRNAVQRTSNFEEIDVISHKERKYQREIAARVLGLERRDMLATSLLALLSCEGGFVLMQGDGVIAIKYHDGSILMRRYEWEDNTPFYPAYAGDDLAEFVRRHGGDLDSEKFSSQISLHAPDGKQIECREEKYSLAQGIRGAHLVITAEELENIDFLAVFSDGITQIEGKDWCDAVANLMAFKSRAGEFVKRRALRGLRDMRRSGHKPYDDISCAVIQINISEKEDRKEKEDDNER